MKPKKGKDLNLDKKGDVEQIDTVVENSGEYLCAFEVVNTKKRSWWIVLALVSYIKEKHDFSAFKIESFPRTLYKEKILSKVEKKKKNVISWTFDVFQKSY